MGWLIFMSGGFFFTAANLIIRQILLVYAKTLTTADVYLITEKCVSSLQAIMSTCMGVIIAQSCSNNIMTDIHWLTKGYAWFGLPYFVYDTWAIYNTHYYLNEPRLATASFPARLKHFLKNNIAMLIHHTMLPVIFFPIILYYREDKGDFFVGIFYTVEAAIPFISLRFILAQLQLKNTATYIVSGLLMIAVFFVVRILVFPFLYWRYSLHAGQPLLAVPGTIPIKCNLGCLLILVLQVYFLALMVRGAARVFFKIHQQRQTAQKSR